MSRDLRNRRNPPGAESPQPIESCGEMAVDKCAPGIERGVGAEDASVEQARHRLLVGDAPDRFGAIFHIDVTNRESGQRIKMSEIAVYTVKDGKIAREEFFYSM